MPRGDKSAYTAKQQHIAEHIEESYEDRGVPKDEAEARAWATVNKQTGGGRRTQAGRQHADERLETRQQNDADTQRNRSEAAKKGWATRRQKATA